MVLLERGLLPSSSVRRQPTPGPWSASISLWNSPPPWRSPRAIRSSWARAAGVALWQCGWQLHSQGQDIASWHQESSGPPWRRPRAWSHCFCRSTPWLPVQQSRLPASGFPLQGANHMDRLQGLPPTGMENDTKWNQWQSHYMMHAGHRDILFFICGKEVW